MEDKISVSKNFYRGNKIKDPMEIREAAQRKVSLYSPYWRLRPASFYYNLQFSFLIKFIENVGLYHIEKK